MATSRIFDSRSGFRGFFGRFGWWPTMSVRRFTSSLILSFVRSCLVWSKTLFGASVWCITGVGSWGAGVLSSEIRGYFLATSFLPPLHQKASSLLMYLRGCLWYSRKVSWRFSMRRRLVQASHLFILRWKYRRKSSFFFSTPGKKCMLFNGKSQNYCTQVGSPPYNVMCLSQILDQKS